MNSIPKYVVDTCSFTALRRIYPPDVFPGAWQAVSEMAECGRIISSAEVLIELEDQEDIVTDWARNYRQIFIPLLTEIQQKAVEILGKFPNLLDLNNQKSNADPFVIATAIINGCVIVTEEEPTGGGAKLIKIPNVCKAVGIQCIHLLDMLRAEQVRLDIQK
jgi:hypothetical protein